MVGEEISQEIAALKELPFRALQDAFLKHFPGKKASNNRTYLWRRLAYKIQGLEHGELSAKAKAKLKAIMNAYDPVNNVMLKPLTSSYTSKRDRRLPLPGTIITKDYKNTKIQVKVLDKGFEYNGKVYKSLTAIAKEVTKCHWNGFLFFNL